SSNDRYCLEFNGGVQAFRVRNCKIQESGGNRGVGVFVSGGGFVEFYNCEFTNNYYQSCFCDPPADHVFFINCWTHDNGTISNNLTDPTTATPGPTAQQHGFYLDGDSHMILNCLSHDNPYGSGIQFRFPDNCIIAHCTSVHNGWGSSSTTCE